MNAPSADVLPPARWLHLALLLTQGAWTSGRTPRLAPAAGRDAGCVGTGPPLALLALGDSIVVGVGVEHTRQALPAVLADRLAAGLGARVGWRVAGRNGARSRDLPALLDALPAGVADPDLVIVSNGINDVTSTLGDGAVLEGLRAGVEAVENRFPRALVLQLGLPPLGHFPALPRPLRGVLGRRAAAADGSLARWLAHRDRAHHLGFPELPDPEQFARDGYHPGPGGVARWAEHLAARIGALWRAAMTAEAGEKPSPVP